MITMFHKNILLGLSVIMAVVVSIHGLGPNAFPHLLNRQKRQVNHDFHVPNNCSADEVPPTDTGVGWDAQQQLMNGLRSAARGEVTGDRSKLTVRSTVRLVTNRALFFSLVMQLLPKFGDFAQQPGFLYHYTSPAATLSAGPSVLVSSGVFFATNSSYPNWFRTMYFNQTFPRFAPYALRQSASQMLVDDYGGDASLNYTLDLSPYPGYMTRTVRIQRINRWGEVTTVPVVVPNDVTTPHLGRPVFECGAGVDSWAVLLSSSVVEIMPRYLFWVHMQQIRQVAVTTASLDVNRLASDLPGNSAHSSERTLTPVTSCPTNLTSPGSLPSRFFEALYPQSRLALRLAHSLSAFLQINQTIVTSKVSDPQEYWKNYYGPHVPPPPPPSYRIKVEKTLSNTLLEAEVLANVLTDQTIIASGIFYDVETYTDDNGKQISTKPRALQATQAGEMVSVADLANTTHGLHSQLMSRSRMDWESAGVEPTLDNFDIHARIRTTESGEGSYPHCPADRKCSGLVDYGLDPMQYKAPRLEQGYWVSPHYQCHGGYSGWVVTYGAPFFGPSAADPSTIIFRGIVTVNISVSDENWRV